MAWDDDKKAQVVSMYEGASPTPETSMEIVKEIAGGAHRFMNEQLEMVKKSIMKI